MVGLVWLGMFDSDSSVRSEVGKMVGLQIGAMVGYVVVGGLIAVVLHQFVLGELPAGEWASVIAWGISGLVGLVVSSVVVGAVVLVLMLRVMSD